MEDVIRKAVEDAMEALGIRALDFTIEHPQDLTFGDFACNVALMAAKEAGRSPRDLAGELLSWIS
jgi:arginyl-tRNA synthetase